MALGCVGARFPRVFALRHKPRYEKSWTGSKGCVIPLPVTWCIDGEGPVRRIRAIVCALGIGLFVFAAGPISALQVIPLRPPGRLPFAAPDLSGPGVGL